MVSVIFRRGCRNPTRCDGRVAGDICVLTGVNNKHRPSQPSPSSQQYADCDGCDGGDGRRLLLWSGKTVMPSRFVTPSPRRKGSFLAIFLYGGRQRSMALPTDQKTRFAQVRGSHPVKGTQLQTAEDANSMLARACSGLSAANQRNGHPAQSAHGERGKASNGAGLGRNRGLKPANR